MRCVVAGIILLCLSGCSISSYLDKIPDTSFKRFEYHRGGNVTSSHIIATNAIAADGILMIDEVSITADYGPAVNFNIKLEGFERVKDAVQ